jgi:multiple antibiotic resistance protein
MLAEILTKTLFLIAVIDPLGSVPVFLEATQHLDEKIRPRVAVTATFIAFLVLLFFIVVGQLILEGMEVTLDAFQISGGVILFLFALTMIFGEGKPEGEKKAITDYRNVTIFPIAIPSIASPGAILSVVLLTDNYVYPIQDQAITVLLVACVLALTMSVLLIAGHVQKWIGEYGITVISKIMGLILSAYAVQNILTGLKDFFS